MVPTLSQMKPHAHGSCGPGGDFDIINPTSIRKVEHAVPDFARNDGSFHVNKFAFIHQRR